MRQHSAITASLVAIVLAASLAGLPASAQDRIEPACPDCEPEPPTPEYVPGQVLVRFWPVVPKARGAQVVAAEGAVRIREIEALEIQVLQLPPEESVEEAIERFNKRPEVKYAQPNYIRRITVVDGPGLDNQRTPTRTMGAIIPT